MSFGGMAARALIIGSGGVLVAGCQFGGLNSLDMPGTKGHGTGGYTITVEVPDVTTLPQNSPVMVDDVTVGSVSGISVAQRPDGTFYAKLKLALEPTVDLPDNATATVAQTTLLGSQHIELIAPHGQPSLQKLHSGSTIPLSHTGRYPTTEEVLSSLGVVVNKGNLGALQDITDEAYAAVANRAGSFTGLLPRLAQLTASLDSQTSDLIAAADSLNRFTGILARNQDSLGRTLDTLPAALRVLNDNRSHIVDAFAALRNLAVVTDNILARTKTDFSAELKDIYPVVKSFADNLDAFINSLNQFPTFPFVGKYIKKIARGDYLNIFATFDLTLRRLGESIFTTSALDANMKHLDDVVNPPDFLTGSMANLSGQAADPFKIPPKAPGTHESPP